MSEHLYDAHPSMFRMRPFATIVVVAIMIAGAVIAFFSEVLLPPETAAQLGGTGGRIVQGVGLVLLVISVLQLFTWWLATRSDHLAITDDELLWTHGLLSKQYTEIAMGSVRTVRIDQSLLQRLMDAGNVSVFTSGDIPEVVIRGLPEPNRIRELVKARSDTEA